MDDITFVRSHWWLVSEGFSLSTANSDVQKLPRHSVPAYCRFPRLRRLKCVKSSLTGEIPVSRQVLLSLRPRLSMAYAVASFLTLGFRSFLPATPSETSFQRLLGHNLIQERRFSSLKGP